MAQTWNPPVVMTASVPAVPTPATEGKTQPYVAPSGPWTKELIRAIAMDIGKAVVHHIETMYPAAIMATPSTFNLSVRNCVHNEIMAAIEVNDEGQIKARLRERKEHRRKIKAAYKKIRA